MLRRAGLLGDDEVARVEARCREEGVTPVLALRDLGLVIEPQLVRFLHSKLMVPAVSPEILDRLDPETLRAVPATLAWKHLVLPVSTDAVGNLTLAMADPTDLPAVEAITNYTRSYLIRAVAPLTPLMQALDRYYPLEVPAPRVQTPAPPREAEADAQAAPPDEAPTRGESSSILDRLREVEDRDALTESLLDFLAAGFGRVMLFVHSQGQLRGRDARGEDLLVDAVAQVRIPTSGSSLFADIIASGTPYFGPWPTQRPIDRVFAQAMGGIAGDILLLPIVLRDRVPLIIFAMGSTAAWDQLLLGELSEAAGHALERVIQRRKTHSGSSLDGP